METVLKRGREKRRKIRSRQILRSERAEWAKGGDQENRAELPGRVTHWPLDENKCFLLLNHNLFLASFRKNIVWQGKQGVGIPELLWERECLTSTSYSASNDIRCLGPKFYLKKKNLPETKWKIGKRSRWPCFSLSWPLHPYGNSCICEF